VKSKKAEITNYYIEQSWSVSLKNIGRQNFVHNSHRTQSNPIQPNPIHGWIQSMDISGPNISKTAGYVISRICYSLLWGSTVGYPSDSL